MARSLALAGCASDVASDPAPHVTAAATAAGEARPLSARVTSEDAKHCSPYECCFPSEGGGWQDNALEDELQALGCTTPAPYQVTGAQFWEWTECRFDLATIATVFRYAGTPYDAHFVENLCLASAPGKVDVVFDPTCSTCSPDLGGGLGGLGGGGGEQQQ